MNMIIIISYHLDLLWCPHP